MYIIDAVNTRFFFDKGQSIRDSTENFRENKGHFATGLEKNKGQPISYVVPKFPYVVCPLKFKGHGY